MSREIFDKRDRQQIEAHGLTEEDVLQQIELFKKGTPYVDLDRPCTVGDGIHRFTEDDIHYYATYYENQGAWRELTKFVPASGAATRMFKALLKISSEHERVQRDVIARQAREKGAEYQEVLEFIDNFQKFAFYEVVAEKMRDDGHDVESLCQHGDFTLILSYVLTDRGLDYSNKPKGQILFHRYTEGPRTAFEEHLAEGALYAKDGKGNCCLHFTVSPEHENGFLRLLENTRAFYETTYGVRFESRFTHQDPSTDTIAVDMDNNPFRDDQGGLVFRPGGHGALIGNLNELNGDIVFIKNIDNMVPDALKPETILWKKVLGGYLLTLETEINAHRTAILRKDAGEKAIADALDFVENKLSLTISDQVKNSPPEETRRYLVDRLDRPLRVCGMVPSSGEAGGGPFWVKFPDGTISLQIVEGAQIDPESSFQQSLLKNLTHFNPVDIVCSLRNDGNEPYDLSRFVDDTAVFISSKSKDGRELKALERPGLWNGAMAYWNTVFVEVPLITFNPVKTINDLLRRAHQG